MDKEKCFLVCVGGPRAGAAQSGRNNRLRIIGWNGIASSVVRRSGCG